MKHIRFLQAKAWDGRIFSVGQEADLPDWLAARFVRQGVAEHCNRAGIRTEIENRDAGPAPADRGTA